MIKQKFFIQIYKLTFKILRKDFPFFPKILNFILAQTTPYPEKIKKDNQTIHLLPRGKVSRELALYGVFEHDETELLKNIVQAGDVVLDIGGNLGYHTLILSDLVGVQGKVFSFEPSLENFGLLKKNVLENNLQNVKIERLAISNISSTTKLFLSEGPGGHRIQQSNFCTDNFDVVNTITLDEYFKDDPIINKINFLKIDVEGAELNVLQGMKSILKNENLKILVELYGPFIREFGHEPNDLFEFFKKNNFKTYFVKKLNNKEPFNIEDLQELENKNDEKLNYELKDQNFLCIKQK